MSDQRWKTAALHLAESTDMSWRQIAKKLGKSKSTVSDYLRTATHGSGPRIGIIDIETSPSLAWIFGRWKLNVSPVQVEEETVILSAAVKELGDASVDFLATWQTGDDVYDDEALVHWLHSQLSKYDILIAHNGDKFDFPIINTRMIYYGLTPPAPYKTVDTLKTLKKRFRFPSNALNAVCGYMGIGEKLPHDGFELWKGVMHGDMECMNTMEKYNIHDVILLEELYMKVRAWENTHPSVAARTHMDHAMCNACGSGALSNATHKEWTTAVSSFTLYQCQDCGHWQRDRKNTIPKEKRDNLGVSVK